MDASSLTVMNAVATHCCVCRAPLTDAESVEHSIGPICSRRYYNPKHVPTPEQVQDALGRLALSGLPDTVIDGVLALSKDGTANARAISNLLVKYASLHYDDRTEVFKCAGIMRALGYIELADKLEQDRTSGAVFAKGDRLEVFIPEQFAIQQALAKIPGISPLMVEVVEEAPMILDPTEPPPVPTTRKEQVKRGRKPGWTIPKTGLPHLECLLGVFMPEELISYGGGDIRKIVRRTHHELYAFTNPKVEMESPNAAVVTVTQIGSNLIVRSPYNGAFIGALKNQIPYTDRKWDPGTRCWSVAVRYTAILKGLIQTHYHVTV